VVHVVRTGRLHTDFTLRICDTVLSASEGAPLGRAHRRENRWSGRDLRGSSKVVVAAGFVTRAGTHERRESA
jgi:hypothetical protein